ncbi:MAG: tyrosine-type recombinase/integrase [Saprospiraceae bacterium]
MTYLQYEKRFSDHTLKAYRTDLEQLASFLTEVYGVCDWLGLSAAQLRTWMAALSEEGQEPATIRRKLSAVKSFFRFWRKQMSGLQDPTKGIQTPKLKKRMPVTVDVTSLSYLLASFPVEDDFSIARDKLILELLYGVGLRRSELLALTEADIAPQEMRLKVMGKGGKERLLPYGAAVAKALERYIGYKRQLFPAINLLICTDKGNAPCPKWLYNKVKQYLGTVPHLERASPHVLRHSFATHLSDAGADLNAVKELLGHTSLAATQVYTHNSIEKLKRAYSQAHPKARMDE